MTLLAMKSFVSGETAAGLSEGGWGSSEPSSIAYVPGRRPGSVALCSTTGNVNLAGPMLQFQHGNIPYGAAWIIGVARLQTALNLSGVSSRTLVNFQSGTNTVCSVRLTTTGLIEVFTNVIVATSTVAVQAETWNYYEVEYMPHNTAGYIKVRLNGVEVLSFSGDTYSGSSSTAVNTVTLPYRDKHASNESFGGIYLQDLYVCDKTGPAPFNAPLGDVAVDRLTPLADGQVSGWQGYDGDNVDNFRNVIGSPDPNLAVYNEASVANTLDLYQFSSLPAGSPNILAVSAQVAGTKDGSGTASVRTVANNGSSEDRGPAVGLGSGITFSSPHIMPKALDGGDWTVPKLAATEFGVEVVE